MGKLGIGFWATFSIILLGSVIPVFAQEETNIETQIMQSAEPFYRPTQDALTKLFTISAESGVAVLGALIVLIIGYFVGIGIQKAIRFFIKKVLTNKFLKEKLGVDQEKMKDEGWYHISNLVPPTIKWFVWIFFFVTAIDLLGFHEASEALSVLWVYIPNIIAFVVIIAIGTVAITFIMKWATTQKDIFGEEHEVTLQKTLVKAILYTIVFSIAITQLGVGEDIIPIIIWLVLGGIMATIVVSAGIGLKDFVPQLVRNKSLLDLGIKEGAKIELTNFQTKQKSTYEILDVGLTHTKVKENEDVKIIPNASWQGYTFNLKEKAKENEKK
jgi:putative Mn2+ efflux pump MntP